MREKIGKGFGRWGHLVARHYWLVIVLSIASVALIGAQARHVTSDFTPDSFLSEGHEARVRYDEMRREFSSDAIALIAIRADDIWTADFLAWLRDLHTALEVRVPYLDEVTSLVNARSTRGDEDSLIVEDLMETWPESEADIAAIRALALENRFYDKLLIAPEASMTVVLVALDAIGSGEVDALAGFDDDFDEGGEGAGAEGGSVGLAGDSPPFLTGSERDAASLVIRQTVEAFARPGTEIHLVGMPIVAERTMKLTRANIIRFTAVAIGMIMLALAALFRRGSGVVLPIVVSLLSVIVTFGAAGMRGSPLGVTSQMIPSMLLAVGTSSSVHLLVIFFQQIDAGRSAADAISEALEHSGLPIFLASVTTAGGIASFNAANLAGLRDVGILAPIGIFSGLALTLTLLPAVLVAVRVKAKVSAEAAASDLAPGPIERALVAVGDVATGHPRTVAVAALIVTAIIGLGTLRLEYVFDPLTFLKEDDPLRASTDYVGEALGTVSNIDVLVDTHQENGLHEPVVLSALDRATRRALDLRGGPDRSIEVAKTVSYIDITKEIHQALNENRPEFYTVPDNRPLAAQELLLFENTGADDLEDFVNSDFSKARLTLRVPWIGASRFGDLLPDTEALFREELGPDIGVELTGLMPLMSYAQEEMRIGLVTSYSLAIVIITPLMMLLIGSVRGGLVSMVPNLMPIILVLGLMGWVGLELSVFTMMIGCIAIGLAVDDTIHIIHQFYRYRAITGTAREAVRSTMRTTGRALLTTSVVLSLGFIVYVFAGLRNLEALGLVTTTAILLAFLSDVIVAPALLTLVSRGADAKFAERLAASSAGAESDAA